MDIQTYNAQEKGGKTVIIAEICALILLFLLPLKFGAIIGLPAVTMIYWRELFPIIISPWPSTLFPLAAAFLLLVTLFCVPGKPFCSKLDRFALIWALIAGFSPLGTFAEGVIVNYPMHMIPYCFGLGAFSLAFARLLDRRPEFGKMILAVVAISAVFSLYSAMSQALSGFAMTMEQVKKLESESGVQFHPNMLVRLKEQRVSADFSACNAYAGYLLLAVPILLGALWKLGGKVQPPILSRLIFTIPVLGISTYVLYRTGSRGAFLSAIIICLAVLLIMRIPKKWKRLILCFLPIGAGAFAAMIALGRGAGSIIFRLDYDWAALRMMLEHPLTGTGWGGFVRHYLIMKLLINDEAPNSPHNLPLTIGSQIGVIPFLLAVLAIVIMFAVCWKYLKNYTVKEALNDDRIIQTAAAVGLAAWTLHTMMEVNFETPGSMASALAVTFAIMNFPENMVPEPQKYTAPHLWKISMILLSLTLIFCASLTALYLVRFELAFEHLNNLTDTRFMTEEQRAFPPDPALVLKASEECDRISAQSPYQTMVLNTYFIGRGDLEKAEHYLNESIRRAPSFSSLYYRKYRMLKEIPSRRADAEKAIQTARKLSPMNPNFQENIDAR